jgi:transposase-like protein
MTDEKMLRVSEVAERYNIAPSTVRLWINKGYFPGTHKLSPATNSPLIIPETAVLEYEKRLKEND